MTPPSRRETGKPPPPDRPTERALLCWSLATLVWKLDWSRIRTGGTRPSTNLSEAIFNPIENAPTALAALLSGEVDMLQTVPVRDVERLRQTDGVSTFEGIETRVIMLGFGHAKDALSYSQDVEGENPFQDVRVRRAVAHAIDVETIIRVFDVRTGRAREPASAFRGSLDIPKPMTSGRPSTPMRRGNLLAEAGFPTVSHSVSRCTNDRYLNDSDVCQAVTSMLAAVGLDAVFGSHARCTILGRTARRQLRHVSAWLVPGHLRCRAIRSASWRIRQRISSGRGILAGYSNARVDELLPRIQQELEPDARQEMLDEVASTLQEEVAYVPLYTEPLLWAARDGVEVNAAAGQFSSCCAGCVSIRNDGNCRAHRGPPNALTCRVSCRPGR